MKKLVQVLTFALCLPFAAVAFSSCSEDEEEPQTETTNQDGSNQDGSQGTQLLTGTLFTLDDKALTSKTLEFHSVEIHVPITDKNGNITGYMNEIKACTTPLEGTSNHLKVTNATDSDKAIKVTVTLLQEKSATIGNISWCGIVQGCADIRNTTPVVREAVLAANTSANLELDAIFTEGVYEDCSFKVELEVEGQAKETITVKFVYTA